MVVSALPLVEFYLGLEKMTKSVSNLEKTIFAFARESQIRIMGESKCERRCTQIYIFNHTGYVQMFL